jgi:hypothetical protein
MVVTLGGFASFDDVKKAFTERYGDPERNNTNNNTQIWIHSDETAILVSPNFLYIISKNEYDECNKYVTDAKSKLDSAEAARKKAEQAEIERKRLEYRSQDSPFKGLS